jgi:hypothetical protein
MNLPTITMDRVKAHDAFLDYRRAGYRQLAKGTPVISLRDAMAGAMRAGAFTAQGLPSLAVTRADARWCHLRVSRRDMQFSPEPWPRGGRSEPSGVMQFDFTPPEGTTLPWSWEMRAIVPIVPPALRPAGALSGYHVLWEVERWEKVPRPPGDPALLKRIGGDLYAVVAVWDLTELERAVLAGRR